MNGTFHFGFARAGVVMVAMIGLFACGSGSTADASGGARAGTAGPDASGAITLALKFVEFSGKDGKPVISQDQANQVVTQINGLYAQCNLRVKLGEYVAVDPAKYSLDYSLSSMGAMDSMRAPFDTDQELVIVNTGAWDHGSMGPANAWTAMPGQSPSGAVLEASVADNANIVAHELGHYLNLDHVNDQANLMNPVIYGDSTHISASQCDEMRRTALAVRTMALR